jgi:hypothetical protein
LYVSGNVFGWPLYAVDLPSGGSATQVVNVVRGGGPVSSRGWNRVLSPGGMDLWMMSLILSYRCWTRGMRTALSPDDQ